MAELDLDALRKARTDLEPKTLKFAGRTWSLPGIVPLECVFALNRSDHEAMLRSLLGDEPPRDEEGEPVGPSPYDEFMECRPEPDDLANIIRGLPKLYGVEVGESEASAPPSPNTGRRSRPTSNASTG